MPGEGAEEHQDGRIRWNGSFPVEIAPEAASLDDDRDSLSGEWLGGKKRGGAGGNIPSEEGAGRLSDSFGGHGMLVGKSREVAGREPPGQGEPDLSHEIAGVDADDRPSEKPKA